MKLAAAAGGGLMLGFHWSNTEASAMEVLNTESVTSAKLRFNSYLSIAPDGTITIMSPNPELGQNIKTSFPLIVAEELDADWSKVKVLQAPLDPANFERQVTGGSGAVPHSWERLRKAGATARHMLVEAAARKWKVSSTALTADKSMVYHKESGRKFSYGELATDAASVPVPAEVKLKNIKNFKLIAT